MKKREPDIWLQRDEKETRLPCGCRLASHVDGFEGEGAAFRFCAMHRAEGAGLLRQIAEELEQLDSQVAAEDPQTFDAAIANAGAALRELARFLRGEK